MNNLPSAQTSHSQMTGGSDGIAIPRGTTPEQQHKTKLNSKTSPLFHNPTDGIAEASRPLVPKVSPKRPKRSAET